jgi:hypothetical protein
MAATSCHVGPGVSRHGAGTLTKQYCRVVGIEAEEPGLAPDQRLDSLTGDRRNSLLYLALNSDNDSQPAAAASNAGSALQAPETARLKQDDKTAIN